MDNRFTHYPQNHIVALTGLAGSGKDTVADILATHVGFTKLAFADPLRNEITHAFQLGIDNDVLHRRDTKEVPTEQLSLCECRDFGFIGAVSKATGATVDSAWLCAPRSPRQIMRWWGTEYRRAQRVNYWTVLMHQRVQQLANMRCHRIVITDVRFENEAAAVRNMGGSLYQVVRPIELGEVEGEHASATDGLKLQPAGTIENNGTLHLLRERVLATWWAQEAQLEMDSLRVEIAA